MRPSTGKTKIPIRSVVKYDRKIAMLRSTLGFLHRCETKYWERTVLSKDTILISWGKCNCEKTRRNGGLFQHLYNSTHRMEIGARQWEAKRKERHARKEKCLGGSN
jgi:hypothetical protein